MEELLDADLAFKDLGLQALLYVELNVQNVRGLSYVEAAQVLRVALGYSYT